MRSALAEKDAVSRPHGVLNGILIIFLVSMLVMLRELMNQGFFSVHIGDTFAYTGWVWQFTSALKEGIVYPRWMPLDFYGYGSPVFILYPPLAFYLTAFLNTFTGSVIRAMNCLQFMALFMTGVGIFFLVREFYKGIAPLLAAVFFIILPDTVSRMYLLGNFASNISAAWFAPVLLFTFRYLRRGGLKNIVYAGASYGGLILTHLITAYMFTFVLAGFVLFFTVPGRRLKGLAAFPMITAAGAMVSASYLLPLIFEKKYVDLRSFITGKWLVFSSFFILPDKTSKMVNLAWSLYYNFYVFDVLFLGSLLVLFALRAGNASGNARRAGVFFAALAAASIFPLFGISSFIWRDVPFFKYIQFPVRWLSITAFSVVFLSAGYLSSPLFSQGKKVFYVAALLLLACIAADSFLIRKAQVFTQAELLPPGGSYWTFEHMPLGVNPKLIKSDGPGNKAALLTGGGDAVITEWKSAERAMKVATATSAMLRVSTFNFPGWRAYLDGQPVGIQTEKDTGAMLVQVPEGTHNLVLKFTDTPVRFYGKIISLSSFLLMVFFICAERAGLRFNRSRGAEAVS